jgi:glucan phosphoethanolaminetransferase (alkaline phosphatase superfamily)
MRSIFQNKLLIILLAVLALGALAVLASGIEQIRFHEAQQYSQKEAVSTEGEISAQDVIEAWMSIPLWKQVLLWILLCMLIIIMAIMMTPEMRKRLLLFLFRLTVTMIAIYYYLKNYGANLLAKLNMNGVALTEPGSPVDTVPAPVFEPPPPSSTVSYLISFVFALLFVLTIWFMYRAWKKYLAANTSSLKEIANIARSSLRDLSSGGDSSDVIIKCYLRMADVVADKRQLRREQAMTPQEFAMRLERAGLPGDAVQRLTRLFEAVRYGDRKSGPKEVNEAVGCLNTILYYCGETT